MAKVKRVVSYSDPSKLVGYTFYCEGCESHHIIRVGEWEDRHGKKRTGWGFNDDLDAPTFTPSLLIYEARHPDGELGHPRCHLFVREGKIQYCGDCGHKLKGQTVDMQDVDDSP